MSIEGFVRAAGAAMGYARESFGSGGAVMVSPAAGVAGSPTVFGGGSGRAADGFAAESGVVRGHIVALGEHDEAGEQQLRDALAAAGVGRDRMDSVIAAAEADVAAMGASTDTPAGRCALVAAIKRHLHDTQGMLDHAGADAQTRAAAANVTAAGYDGIGQQPPGGAAAAPMAAMGSPMGAMSALSALPAMAAMPMSGVGLPMGGGGLPLAPLAGLAGLFTQSHQTPTPGGQSGGAGGQILGVDEPTSGAAAIPVGDVRYDPQSAPGGRGPYSTYIAKALDVMGIHDPIARANWTRGLETGVGRESGFNPMAVNRSDSNAHGPLMADGAPAGSSRGGLQTIPATFAANHQPGTSTEIYDPVANIAAAMNYLMRRYHVQRDGSNLAVVGQFNPHHAPQGY
ncbi:transglycosylase SLT domain-containing protein [Mycobacterium riyadhense]|uniref:transglycosylase SLT domain-containing protein n=1 Tax=Mycobacterium riyadhense TaxID=486698 RepID=UPI001EF9CAEC|nr:transglycosylase SLT domain-containing protein [Mycobacterium riyadhense]